MKKIVVHAWGGPEELKMIEQDTCEPGPGEVLVRMEAIGINPVDTYLRSGELTFLGLPFTPGFDGAGVVEAAGDGVRYFVPGQRVFTGLGHSGTYAEKVLCQADHVFPLPDETGFEEGASLYLSYGTAYEALFEAARITGTETVLIHGATGGVGIAAVQMAVSAGCTVIASAGSEEGRTMLQEMGAALAVDHTSDEHYRAVMEFTSDRGVDLILEMNSGNLPRDVSVLAFKGTLIIIGGKEKPETVIPIAFTNNGFTLRGVNIGHLGGASRSAFIEYLIAGLRNGSLKPVIHKVFDLAHAPEAHRFLMNNRAMGKILLKP